MSNFFLSSMHLVSEIPSSISTKQYMPLCFDGIHGFLNIIPNDVRNKFPKFSGNHLVLASHHAELFSDLMGDYEIAHEDFYMKLFVQTLEGDARDWFSFLLACSISSWGELHSSFMEKFGERVRISNSYDKFLKIHIECDEFVPWFNIRFAKVLSEIPENYRPNDQMCLVVYFNAFDKKINYLLRDE